MSGIGTVWTSGMPDIVVSAGRDRRGADRRRGDAARRVVVVPSDDAAEDAFRDVERRVLGARRAVERVDEALRDGVLRRAAPAVRRAVDEARRAVDDARRVVDEALRVEPLATSRAFFVRPSMRFNTLLTSARVLAFLTWD